MVIAAPNEGCAKHAAKALHNEWFGAVGADEIGFEDLDTDDVFDMRDVPPETPVKEVSHLVAE